MDFELSEEQRAFQDTARAFARDEMMPWRANGTRTRCFRSTPCARRRRSASAASTCRDDVGGSALTRLDATIIFEELAQGCTSTAAYISIHNMVAWMIDAFGADELRQRLLPDLCTMANFASYCLTEPDSGSDAASLKTRAVRRATTTCSTAPRRSSRAAAVPTFMSAWCARARAGREGISCIAGREGHARAFVRRAGEEARLEVAADRHGDLRELPRAGREPDRRRGGGLQDRDGAGSTAGGSTSRPARSAARSSVSTAPSTTCASESSSARGWRISRRCDFASPTTRPSSRRRG